MRTALRANGAQEKSWGAQTAIGAAIERSGAAIVQTDCNRDKIKLATPAYGVQVEPLANLDDGRAKSRLDSMN